MYPKVYVSETFLESFDEKIKEVDTLSTILDVSGDVEIRRRSLCRIRDLLLSSDVVSDVHDRKLTKLLTRKTGAYEKMSEVIFHALIKEAAFSSSRAFERNIPESDGVRKGYCCFTGKTKEESARISSSNGIIVVGKEGLDEPFFLEHTFAAESTDADLEQKVRINHPCASLLLIDRYFLADGNEKKIDSFIGLLNEIINHDSDEPFEVDIICANPEYNPVLDSAFDKILHSARSKISLHLYAPRKNEFKDQSDRFVLTNYSVTAIGHPFDRKSYITSNFYPSCESKKAINAAYAFWRDRLLYAESLINATPKEYSHIKARKSSDEIDHVIFSQLS